MTDVKTLEEEILLWALDSDSINNLTSSDVGLRFGCAEVLPTVQRLTDKGLLRVYIEAQTPKENREVSANEITSSLLEKALYVTVNKIDRTLSRLREIRRRG